MKIGDTVAIRISRRRDLVFGRLVTVSEGVAQVVVNGKTYIRQLKRVYNYRKARSEIEKKKDRWRRMEIK